MPAFGQCCYVLAVEDADATQAYFVDRLGFTSLGIDAPGWRFVQRDTARFDLGECRGAPQAHTTGNHSWVARIFVEDLLGYFAEISALGAQADHPKDQPWGLREMLVHTPDGHRLMFCEDLK